MAAPEYVAQDSDAWGDDASVASGDLQVLDRNVQWLRNERLPVVGTAFRQITSTQVDTAHVPIWYAARWTAGQSLRYYAPSALRAPDGTATVDLLLSFAVTGTVYLVAINEADGALTESKLDEAIAASADNAATLTASDTSARLTVRVRPGAWNVLRVCFRSALDQSSPSSSSTTVSATPFWIDDMLAVVHGGSIGSTEPLWVALAPGASVTVDDARPVYTAARIDQGTFGASTTAFAVAETEYDARPTDSEQAYTGTVYWGAIGTIALKSVAADPNSVQSEQANNARLRWRQGLGQALERIAIDTRSAHRARAPQYGLICDQTDIDTSAPTTWRHAQVNTTGSGGVSPSNELMSSWTFRWRDSYGDLDSYIECAWGAMLAGAEGVEVDWRLSILDASSVAVVDATRSDALPPADPSVLRTARWVYEAAGASNQWAMRGCTHIGDIGTAWQQFTLRVPTADLTDGELYFAALRVSSDATTRRGYITLDGASCRLVLP